ncbi:MAG: hypothetical protein HY540_04610 [Deltaproteobacteria bacterium]|nr:hypothetical protein [Deltaproteobacteria bacterium]
MNDIKNVTVIGAGVMGSQIAALFAGIGCKVWLLDREEIATAALKKLTALKPSPLFRGSDLKRILPGNIDRDLRSAAQADLVIEAIIEKIDVKRELFGKLDGVRGPNTVIASNTSGISVAALVEGRSIEFRRHFCVTHFFNPPRYLKLLELVPCADTDPGLLKAIAAFAEQRLGKGVVIAKDTPNFIANRIGIYHFFDIMHLAEECGWMVEAVDEVLGPATCHPKSAIFRTADIIGLDTLLLAAETVLKGCSNDPHIKRLCIPQYLQKMIAKGWIGQKAGQGFYQKDRETQVLRALDPATLEYRPITKFRTDSLTAAASMENPRERLCTVILSKDPAAEIAWPAISRTLVYAALRIPEIADDIVHIDRAMKWGFNWELGPFEMWDALGIREVVKRLEKDMVAAPPLVEQLLSSGKSSFYEWDNAKRLYFDSQAAKLRPEDGGERRLSLPRLKEMGRTIHDNGGATLIDLDDGVFCLEFHTKMNAIDGNVISMLHAAVEYTEKKGVGLLIGNDGPAFSAGANLMHVLMAAHEKRFTELDAMVRGFQTALQRIRFSSKPVMAVPFNTALGGGCEIVLAAGRSQAFVESYLGLVEVGAGLIPAGGGCKNLLLRFEGFFRAMHKPEDKIWFSPDDGGPFNKVRQAFELIGTARFSGSAFEARELGYLRREDGISMNRDYLLMDAKRNLLEWSKSYAPPQKRDDIVLPGRGGKMALVNALRDWRLMEKITAYDEVVGTTLAHVLAGGDRPCMYPASEEHILDLEREAFLSLCGRPQTLARMEHLLKTGKPLRN